MLAEGYPKDVGIVTKAWATGLQAGTYWAMVTVLYGNKESVPSVIGFELGIKPGKVEDFHVISIEGHQK